jgi:hypothetical protein
VLHTIKSSSDLGLLAFIMPGSIMSDGGRLATPPPVTDEAVRILTQHPRVKELMDAVQLRAELYTVPAPSGEPIAHNAKEILAALIQARTDSAT